MILVHNVIIYLKNFPFKFVPAPLCFFLFIDSTSSSLDFTRNDRLSVELERLGSKFRNLLEVLM